MRVWFDTEFEEAGQEIKLISIGLVNEKGATFYAELAEYDRKSIKDPWITQNVIPHLHGPILPRSEIAAGIADFAEGVSEFWAYTGSYDWVALCQLYGGLLKCPKGWPKNYRDVRVLRQDMGDPPLPPMNGTAHDALADAIHCRAVWKELERRAWTDDFYKAGRHHRDSRLNP